MNHTPRSLRMKDFRQQAEVFRARALVGFAIILLCLCGLITRFYSLQISHHDEFTAKSESNRISTRGIAPSRGLIYDRNGVLLADNVPAFRLEVVPDKVQNMPALLAQLGEVVPLGQDDLETFKKQLQQSRRFDSVPLKLHLTEDRQSDPSIQRSEGLHSAARDHRFQQ